MNQQFTVKGSERGKCLEAFLHSKLEGWSHRQIKQAIDKKKVFINGKNIFIAKWNLKGGDRVQLTGGPEVSQVELTKKSFINVLFEDAYILVLNKPAFIDYDTFVLQVGAYLKRTNEKKNHRTFYPYVGQVHRLDKETSGILLFTKKKIANTLLDQFRTRKVKKYYWALVDGAVQREQGIIEEKLEKGIFKGGKKVQVVKGEGGKEARTEYMVQERYANVTLLRILLGTGRTHQIRVHMAEIGHPLVGDKLYGSGSALGLKRQALHAAEIQFIHPITNKKMKFECPIPMDLANAVDRLRMGQ